MHTPAAPRRLYNVVVDATRLAATLLEPVAEPDLGGGGVNRRGRGCHPTDDLVHIERVVGVCRMVRQAGEPGDCGTSCAGALRSNSNVPPICGPTAVTEAGAPDSQ